MTVEEEVLAEMNVALRKAAETYIAHLTPVLSRLNVNVEEVMNGLWQDHTALLINEATGETVAILWKCEFSTNPQNIALVIQDMNQAQA